MPLILNLFADAKKEFFKIYNKPGIDDIKDSSHNII